MIDDDINNPAYTKDSFLDKGLVLTQPVHGFRAGSDAVFLARAIEFPKNSHILDVGCGLGGAGLCAVYKNSMVHVTGIEIQEPYVHLANYNAVYNHLDNQFKAIQGDIKDVHQFFQPDYFTHIITNPPFYEKASGRLPNHLDKSHAHHGDNVSLDIWIRKSLSVLKNAGIMLIIIRTERLQDVMNALAKRAGDIHILPLISRKNDDAKRVLIKCRKASKAGTKILTPLIVHQDKARDYTREAESVLTGKTTLGI